MRLDRRLRDFVRIGVATIVCSAAGGSQSRADYVGLGTAGQYAVLGINTTFSFNGPGVINGNVALTSGSSYNLASPAVVNGTFYHDTGVTGSNSGVTFSGGTVTTNLSQAVTDAQNAAASAAAQTPTATMPGNVIGNNTSFTGVAGQNVLDVNSVNLTNGNFTLTGPASATFIINVAGNITVNGGSNSSILLAGGVTPDHVLFNVTGSGNTVSFTGGGTLAGTFLDLNGSISVHDKTLNGALIGGQDQSISDTSGFKIIFPPHVVPEPSSVVLLGLGSVLALFRVAHRGRCANAA